MQILGKAPKDFAVRLLEPGHLEQSSRTLIENNTWIANFFSNGPMMFQNANNRFTTTTLQTVADLSGNLHCF